MTIMKPIRMTTAPLSVTQHPLYQTALHLATLSPTLNPIINPSALQSAAVQLGTTPASLQTIAATPALAALATGATTPPATASASTSVETGGSSFDPANFTRLPSKRHMLLGMAAATTAGAGTAACVFTPQVDVKPNHLMLPSNQTWMTAVSNCLVGAFPQSVAATNDDPEEFWETSLGGMWDLDECEVGLEVTFNLGHSIAATSYGVLTCEAADQKAYSLPRSALKRVGLGQTVVGPGLTVVPGGSLGITPQVGFKPRKVMLSANVAGLIILNWQIGINPCFASKDPVPALALSTFAQYLWFDLDEARVGNGVFFGVYNPTTANITFSGGMLGDVNPGDVNAQGGR